MIGKKQDITEKKLEESFNLVNEQLAAILAQPRPSNVTQNHPNQHIQQQTSPSSQTTVNAVSTKFQCNTCGKSFGSSRALTNHTRKDHEPN